MRQVNKQKGFTIIELVVVILLLGILTATALPRFMDVTDEAHDAVVEGVVAGLSTSAALFRAQWYAEGQPNTVVDYASMNPLYSSGYPLGSITGNSVMVASDDCVEIYTTLLQAGRPSIIAKTADDGSLTTLKTTTVQDFVAYLNTDTSVTSRICTYAYTGEYRDSSLGGMPVILYNATTGEVSLGTEL